MDPRNPMGELLTRVRHVGLEDNDVSSTAKATWGKAWVVTLSVRGKEYTSESMTTKKAASKEAARMALDDWDNLKDHIATGRGPISPRGTPPPRIESLAKESPSDEDDSVEASGTEDDDFPPDDLSDLCDSETELLPQTSSSSDEEEEGPVEKRGPRFVSAEERREAFAKKGWAEISENCLSSMEESAKGLIRQALTEAAMGGDIDNATTLLYQGIRMVFANRSAANSITSPRRHYHHASNGTL